MVSFSLYLFYIFLLLVYFQQTYLYTFYVVFEASFNCLDLLNCVVLYFTIIVSIEIDRFKDRSTTFKILSREKDYELVV